MKRPRPTLCVRLRETGFTDVLRTHMARWVSVSPALVESDSMNMVLSEDQKEITILHCGFPAWVRTVLARSP